MNTVGYFEIQASDPRALLNFYRTVFGWTFTLVPMPNLEYYSIETGGIPGGLFQRPAAVPHTHMGTNAFVCSIEVADFDATAKTIMAQGGQVAMGKFAVPGKCWQGYFLDPDNNTIGVFQPDASAK